jgi:hypothetical protein
VYDGFFAKRKPALASGDNDENVLWACFGREERDTMGDTKNPFSTDTYVDPVNYEETYGRYW